MLVIFTYSPQNAAIIGEAADRSPKWPRTPTFPQTHTSTHASGRKWVSRRLYGVSRLRTYTAIRRRLDVDVQIEVTGDLQ